MPPQSQVLDSNSQHGADNNNYFTAKRSEKARRMGLPTKAIAICAGKKEAIMARIMTEVVNRYLLG